MNDHLVTEQTFTWPLVFALNGRFVPHSSHWCKPQRTAASLIGCLGQARFPCLFWGIVTHPGHASLRSLVDAVMAPLHAYVGSAVESLA